MSRNKQPASSSASLPAAEDTGASQRPSTHFDMAHLSSPWLSDAMAVWVRDDKLADQAEQPDAP